MRLSEFSIDRGGDDDRGEDPYKYPKPEHYNHSVDFFGQFDADHFDKEDMNDATGEFKGYWDYNGKLKQIAYFKFDNAQRSGSDDPGMGWYYEPESDNNSNVTSAEPSVDNSNEREQQELSMIKAFLKSGQKSNPGSQIYQLMKRHGMAEGQPKEKEADYGDDYQAMVSRVKKLAGLGPLKTVYDPQKRVYKNVPVAVQPAQQPKKER